MKSPAGQPSALVAAPSEVLQAALIERAHKFARWALEVRAAPLAVKPAYRLRVHARRTESACKAIAPLLRRKDSARAREALRELRRAAGVVRDADVRSEIFAARLGHAARISEASAVAFVVGRISAQRDAAALRLAEVAEEHAEVAGNLPAVLADAVKPSAKVEGERYSSSEIVVRGIRRAAKRFIEDAEADLTVLDLLHEMRLSGKKLRYALVSFQQCMPPAITGETLTRLKDCQDRLGAINDKHELVNSIDATMQLTVPATVRSGLASLRHSMHAELEREHAGFVRWWWDVGAAQQLLGCVHELALLRAETRDD